MKYKLFNTKPKRIFTFGCSFTGYNWATWANILGEEFQECEFYNYGQSGAGNVYISNMVTQADCVHNFTDDDLVIVNWTNVSREDRYSEKKEEWIRSGNIYSQDVFSEVFVKNWANETHYRMRDYSLISLVYNLLKNKTQFHFFSMLNLKDFGDQWKSEASIKTKQEKTLDILYKDYLSKIKPSMYEVLWNNNLQDKMENDMKIIHPNFRDGHPLPTEHLEYLQRMFDYTFSSDTVVKVQNLTNDLISFLRENIDLENNECSIHHLSNENSTKLIEDFSLRKGKRSTQVVY